MTLTQSYSIHELIAGIRMFIEENEDDEKAEEVIEQCDDIFFANEEEINKKLESYANTIQL